MVTVGTAATDWANDGLFGDGWHLFGIGTSAYEESSKEYTEAMNAVNAFIEIGNDGSEELAEALDTEAENFDPDTATAELAKYAAQFTASDNASIEIENEEDLSTEEVTYTGEMCIRDRFQTFIEVMKDRPASYAVFMTLYFTGIREGELLALTPSDIDFEKKTLTVNKSYQRLGKEMCIRDRSCRTE